MSTKDGSTPVNYGTALVMGFALGLILDNIAMGLVTGLALATVSTALREKRQNALHANLTLAISTAGLIVVILLWILSAAGIF